MNFKTLITKLKETLTPLLKKMKKIINYKAKGSQKTLKPRKILGLDVRKKLMLFLGQQERWRGFLPMPLASIYRRLKEIYRIANTLKGDLMEVPKCCKIIHKMNRFQEVNDQNYETYTYDAAVL
jgi:hypothetical protein